MLVLIKETRQWLIEVKSENEQEARLKAWSLLKEHNPKPAISHSTKIVEEKEVGCRRSMIEPGS